MGVWAGLTIELGDRSTPEILNLRVCGPFDVLSAETLERLIRREIALGARRVVLDATDLQRLDRDVAAMLARVAHTVALEIDSPNLGVQRALASVGFMTQTAPAQAT